MLLLCLMPHQDAAKQATRSACHDVDTVKVDPEMARWFSEQGIDSDMLLENSLCHDHTAFAESASPRNISPKWLS